MHWYLVHTKSWQEKYALQNLEQQGYQCYLPTERFRQGLLTVNIEPLFPRYLFIRLGLGSSAKSWAPIRSTKGFNRIVSFGTEPARVNDDLIDLLRVQEMAWQGKSERLFNPGDRAQLAEGAFAGIEGIYQIDRRRAPGHGARRTAQQAGHNARRAG
jgi:transcriptional antiterminator RfaH